MKENVFLEIPRQMWEKMQRGKIVYCVLNYWVCVCLFVETVNMNPFPPSTVYPESILSQSAQDSCQPIPHKFLYLVCLLEI